MSQLGAQSARLSEKMNEKLSIHLRNKVGKLKAVAGLVDTKGPEMSPRVISAAWSGKRSAENSGKFHRERRRKHLKVSLSKIPPSQETSVCQQGMSSEIKDVFSFPAGDDGKNIRDSDMKQNVLKTISKMLEENRVIREQGPTLSQMNK